VVVSRNRHAPKTKEPLEAKIKQTGKSVTRATPRVRSSALAFRERREGREESKRRLFLFFSVFLPDD
jgi:hypothetical protein